MNIKEYIEQTTEKYDLIIATELIEHLDEPNDFLDDCIKLLKVNGKIILTTPNKDYHKKNGLWQTDLPPVHITWLGKKAMMILAEKHNFKAVFENFSGYYPSSENKLYKYLYSRKEIIQSSALTKAGFPIIKYVSLQKRISYFFINKISAIRLPSNFIYNMINGDEITLGVILEKKK